jgi:hypothetical protein
MSKFLYFTSGVTYRIPIDDKGIPGTPELLKKWTSPYSTTKGTERKIVKSTLIAVTGETEEL